jgi:asparagine synthase (glutamine-hydrolysing)
LGFGLARAVRDSARISRKPYLSVLAFAWSQRRNRHPLRAEEYLKRLNHTIDFIRRDALPVDLESYAAHKWTRDAADLPKGKQLQIHLLTEILNRHRPMPDCEPVPEHHVLLSQPLLELSLQIPTYLMLQGGRHRALARDAFSDRVPPEIIGREDKGETSTFVTDTIRQSEAYVAQLLLGGLLAQHRIMDRQALEPFILHGQSFRIEHIWPLLACIATEMWLQVWSGSHASAGS